MGVRAIGIRDFDPVNVVDGAGALSTAGIETAPPVANRAPASEDQVRAVIGGVLFAASLYYVVSTLVRVARTARG